MCCNNKLRQALSRDAYLHLAYYKKIRLNNGNTIQENMLSYVLKLSLRNCLE